MRYAAGIHREIILDVAQQGNLFRQSTIELASLTNQPDPQKRLKIGLRAYDQLTSQKEKENVPMVWMLLHYVRILDDWHKLEPAYALNIIVADVLRDDGYAISAWMIPSDTVFSAESIPAFCHERL